MEGHADLHSFLYLGPQNWTRLEQRAAFHFWSVPTSSSCCLTCLPSWPEHLSNGKTSSTTKRQRGVSEKTRVLQGSHTDMHPAHQHQAPFPILEHTTHPAPAVASHPHASPGLRDLWTPHTSVSANICSLSLHTPLAKACQDVSTGTYSSQQCVQF